MTLLEGMSADYTGGASSFLVFITAHIGRFSVKSQLWTISVSQCAAAASIESIWTDFLWNADRFCFSTYNSSFSIFLKNLNTIRRRLLTVRLYWKYPRNWQFLENYKKSFQEVSKKQAVLFVNWAFTLKIRCCIKYEGHVMLLFSFCKTELSEWTRTVK